MNKLYKNYLKSMGVISEEDFNEVISSFPGSENLDFEKIYWDEEQHDKETLSVDILYKIFSLNNWNTIQITDYSFEEKYFEIESTTLSMKMLKEIKEFFKETEWKISNYDFLALKLLEDRKKNLFYKILENLSEDQLIEITKEYGINI